MKHFKTCSAVTRLIIFPADPALTAHEWEGKNLFAVFMNILIQSCQIIQSNKAIIATGIALLHYR